MARSISKRWLRFSLRAMLLLVLVICVWMAIWSNRARKQRDFVNSINPIGNSGVMYRHQIDATGKGIANPSLPGPGWLRGLLGDHAFFEIYSVGLVTARDEYLRAVADFTSIEQLSLSDWVSDDGIAYLSTLRNLKVLDIQSLKISDRSIEVISKLPRLEGLGLAGAAVTDEGLKPLARLRNLRFVGLVDTQVTAAGGAWLKKQFPTLHLSVAGGSLASAEEEKEAVQELIQLGGRFTADQQGFITGVSMGGSAISDEKMVALVRVLAKLERLEHLHLSAGVTDAGLLSLQGFRQLKWLTLFDSSVTDAGIEKFKRLNPQCSVARESTLDPPKEK